MNRKTVIENITPNSSCECFTDSCDPLTVPYEWVRVVCELFRILQKRFGDFRVKVFDMSKYFIFCESLRVFKSCDGSNHLIPDGGAMDFFLKQTFFP